VAIAAFRATGARYTRLFVPADLAVRVVRVSTREPQPGPQPMMRMQSTAAAAAPLPIEPGKALVTATVIGSVQMK
jgi:uncharacterized protein YggE